MALFFWHDKPQKHQKEAPSLTGSPNTEALKRFLIRAVGLVTRNVRSREEWCDPEYDLEEIRRAAAADSYIKRSLESYSRLIFKAGYKLKSENEKALEYIKKRFRVMSFATGTPMDLLFQNVADDINRYGNAFLLKSRTERPFPGIKMKGVYRDNPVGGYFIVDPTTIRIKRNKHGKVQQYIQQLDGEEKKFAPEDVIHFYMDRESGHAFGTPRIAAALEDVKLLRKVEGIVVSMVYRFAIPLYHWTVGLEDPALGATQKEIDDARAEVENMSLDGAIITNERTKIKVVGAEGEAIDAEEYLKYFERRVFSALSLSEAQMGRGGSKQDADSMEAQAHDVVKNIQKNLAVFIESYMIGELLLEGGFNPILDEDDSVYFEFEEISLETKVKKENHELLKFQSDVITFEELRRNLGKKDKVDEKRLYSNMIQSHSMIANYSAQNIDRPQNQHGQRMAPKIKESFMKKGPMHNNRTIYDYQKIFFMYNQIKNTTIENNISSSKAYSKHREEFDDIIENLLTRAAEDGWTKGITESSEISDIKIIEKQISVNEEKEKVNKRLEKAFEDLDKKTKNKTAVEITNAFEVIEYRIRFMMEYSLPHIFWAHFLKAGAAAGIKTAYVDFDGSDDEMYHPEEIDTKNYKAKEVPPYHAHCDCKLYFKREAGETT